MAPFALLPPEVPLPHHHRVEALFSERRMVEDQAGDLGSMRLIEFDGVSDRRSAHDVVSQAVEGFDIDSGRRSDPTRNR
jgi:hypothetical protein